MNKQSGLSIVELMIAMSLSLLLAIGIFQVFTSNQQSARLTQALVQVQDTGRLSLELMSRDIRNADYWGCAGDISRVSTSINTLAGGYDSDLHGFGLAAQVGIRANDNVAAGFQVGGANVRVGTDVLHLRSMASQGLSIAQSMPSTAANLFLTDNNDIAEGDILAVSDCQSADVFQVTNVNVAGGADNVVHNAGGGAGGPVPGNATGSLSRQYPAGAQILFPTYRAYFIDDNGGDPQLRMWDENGGAPSVLADGVQDMQLIFGLDSTGDGVANQFVTAATIDADAALNFQQVLSVEVRLVVASPQVNVVDTGIAYDWNGGVALDADDDLGRLRREFTSIATIRSRLP
jgi:type IV pilus assembly protein PilW